MIGKAIKIKDGSKVFFTSDTHFNHKNAIEYNNRPFSDVNDMTEQLINNWNSVVPKDGIVFHLGDFAMGGSSVWTTVASRLNGTIYLILGNHDLRNWRPKYNDMFENVSYQMHIIVEDQPIYLNHYPFATYSKCMDVEQPIWELFGHVHHKNQTRQLGLLPTQYNVCTDLNNYKPISYNEVKKKIQQQTANTPTQQSNNVYHPKHYTSHPSGVECIDIARHYCFNIGCAIKYLWRAGLKNEKGMTDKAKEIEDLQKAVWYINDRIKELKGKL